MKRLFIILAAVCMAVSGMAQDKLQFNAVNHETNAELRYKLYPTFNMWTYLKLDTQTGRVLLLQYSTNKRSDEGEYLIGKPSETYYGEEAVNGRYELYPTSNMWTFIMIDQINGNTYHVQWSNQDLTANILYRIN